MYKKKYDKIPGKIRITKQAGIKKRQTWLICIKLHERFECATCFSSWVYIDIIAVEVDLNFFFPYVYHPPTLRDSVKEEKYNEKRGERNWKWWWLNCMLLELDVWRSFQAIFVHAWCIY